MKKRAICFGEVLWDLLPDGARVGGAPLNVCYHLNKLGVDSKIISQVGIDKLGEELLAEINSLEVDNSFCNSTFEYPTSTVTVKLDACGKPEYTIIEHVAWDYISYNEHIANAISQAEVFVFGSLAARYSHSLETLKAYLKRSKYAIMDINLREPFYQKDNLLDLISYADTLKLNDEELLLIGNWLNVASNSEYTCLDLVFTMYPRLQDIILTKGADGALYYSRDKTIEINAYKIKVNDTVGAGDAFLGAYLAMILQDKSVEESLAEAALLSAFVATQSGACPNYTINDLQNFKIKHKIND